MIDKPIIIGSDEVGTGSFFAHLTVCAVKAPKDWNFPGLNDSKAFKVRSKREKIRDQLLKCPDIEYIIAERSAAIIDEIGLAAALKQAYVEAFTKLYDENSFIIVDGILKFPNLGMDYQSLIKADTKIPHVMAASIIGKTDRDDKMVLLSKDYPNYGFETNSGYGAKKHKDGIRKYGLTNLHRKSYNIKL